MTSTQQVQQITTKQVNNKLKSKEMGEKDQYQTMQLHRNGYDKCLNNLWHK